MWDELSSSSCFFLVFSHYFSPFKFFYLIYDAYHSFSLSSILVPFKMNSSSMYKTDLIWHFDTCCEILWSKGSNFWNRHARWLIFPHPRPAKNVECTARIKLWEASSTSQDWKSSFHTQISVLVVGNKCSMEL